MNALYQLAALATATARLASTHILIPAASSALHMQKTLEGQDLPHMYLAHHELKSVIIITILS